MKYYFSKHYSLINQIDIDSEASFKSWYNKTEIIYKYELERLLGKSYKNKSIVDLGCGIGGVLNFLKIRNCQNFFGVDSSAEQVEVCRRFVSDKVAKMDLFEFLLSNKQKYDIVIMLDLIEHISKNKIIELLHLVQNSLSPEGKVIIRTPNMGNILGLYGRYIDFTHETGFTTESLHQVLSEAEFVDINFFNSAIGMKRIYLLKFIHRILSFIYNSRVSEIVTSNILATANKKH